MAAGGRLDLSVNVAAAMLCNAAKKVRLHARTRGRASEARVSHSGARGSPLGLLVHACFKTHGVSSIIDASKHTDLDALYTRRLKDSAGILTRLRPLRTVSFDVAGNVTFDARNICNIYTTVRSIAFAPFESVRQSGHAAPFECRKGGPLCGGWQGEVVEIRLMAKCGADVSSADYDRRTALHLAASVGQVPRNPLSLNCTALHFLLRCTVLYCTEKS